MNPFSITKRIDSASTALFRDLVTGKHIKNATVTFVKPGAKPFAYLIYKFDDLLLTDVDQSGAPGETGREDVSDEGQPRVDPVPHAGSCRQGHREADVLGPDEEHDDPLARWAPRSGAAPLY